MISRRGFFGILAAAAAPAIIRTPGLLMPIKPLLNQRPQLTLAEYAKRVLDPAVLEHWHRVEQAILFGDPAEMPIQFSGLPVVLTPPDRPWFTLS